MFVAYGKDRVSFTYELAARGFVFVVQPSVFLIHHRTPSAERKYGHQPWAWMIGETCWPDFEVCRPWRISRAPQTWWDGAKE